MSVSGHVKTHQDKLKEVVNIFASIPLYDFQLVRFKDRTHSDSKFRFWVAFRFDESCYCVLNTVTSKVDKVLSLYKYDENGGGCVIQIAQDEFNPPFDLVSCIDCNIKSSSIKKYAELAENIIDWKKGLEKSQHTIPNDIKNKIAKAIVKSHHTPEDIKKPFREKYNIA